MKDIPLTLVSASCGENMGKIKLDSANTNTAIVKTGGKGTFVCGYCGHTLVDGQHLPNFPNAAGYCNSCGWLNHLTKPAKYPQAYSVLLKRPPAIEFIGRKHLFVDSGPYASVLAPLNNSLYAYWAKYQSAFPDVLYHYTTISGLIGIVQSGSLRATDMRFLNDSTELEYARDILLKRVEKETAIPAEPPSPVITR